MLVDYKSHFYDGCGCDVGTLIERMGAVLVVTRIFGRVAVRRGWWVELGDAGETRLRSGRRDRDPGCLKIN